MSWLGGSVSFWVKNTKKKEDAMLTFATISFAVTTLCFLLSAIGHISFGSFSADFSPMDSGLMTAYLGATFSAYVARRWTDKKYDSSEEKTEEVEVAPK
jgi:hypothetical protein